jgi:hypothetical protein
MERVAVFGMKRIHGLRSYPVCIVVRIWAPMQRAGDFIVSSEAVRVIIATALHDVDFSTGRPGTVGFCHGHHPDGWPEPVTFGDFGCYLDAAILDACAKFGIDTAGSGGRDDGAIGGVRGCYAIAPES